MKKCFLLLLVVTSFSSFAQTDYSKVTMASDADYKTAEKPALEASNYLLSAPMDATNKQAASATQFLIKWIEGTPDYTFIIDSPVMEKLVSENKSFLGVYLAGMTKFALENKAQAQDMQLLMVNGFKTLIAYSEKAENKVPMTETIKKLTVLNQNGELEKYLKQ